MYKLNPIFFYFIDLNVEHLQLLLLVWHNFSSKKRDKILVLCINAVCSISRDPDLSDKIPLFSMRLLTILDYMLHQYNEPPPELLTQVLLPSCKHTSIVCATYSIVNPMNGNVNFSE